MSDRSGTIRHVVTLPNPWAVPVVTVAVAGQLLGMSRTAVYRAVRRGDLALVMPGRVSVFALYSFLGAPVPPRPVMPAVGR